MTTKPLTIVGLGCGGRTRTYCQIASRLPHRYRVVAAADPNPIRVAQIQALSRNPDFRCFSSDAELFAAGKLADICIIGTQDAQHVEHCIRAMETGYDVLLEKPVASDPAEVVHLLAESERLGRKVMVCHVLRYAPFYVKVHEIIASGALGDVVTINASEGVGAWHHGHSFVRGHWAVTGSATPMLIAKSCHDLDIISWLVNRPCVKVDSFGSLSHFTAASAPEGAPARCTDGCPVGDTCPYNAMLYASQHRGWLQWVMDDSENASEESIRSWLTSSPWGRCVYRCENDAVDHQVVLMEFEGGVTGTFTMTAFDSGRNLTICGTKATLRGGDEVHAQSGNDIIVQFHTGDTVRYGVSTDVGGYAGHGGGDPGLVHAMDREFSMPAQEMTSGLPASVESHMIGYAAEKARHSGASIRLDEFRKSLGRVG